MVMDWVPIKITNRVAVQQWRRRRHGLSLFSLYFSIRVKGERF
jgi:hypothetical protein